jgi:hypothetical protein
MLRLSSRNRGEAFGVVGVFLFFFIFIFIFIKTDRN